MNAAAWSLQVRFRTLERLEEATRTEVEDALEGRAREEVVAAMFESAPPGTLQPLADDGQEDERKEEAVPLDNAYLLSRWPALEDLRGRDVLAAVDTLKARFPTRVALDSATRDEIEAAVAHLGDDVKAVFAPAAPLPKPAPPGIPAHRLVGTGLDLTSHNGAKLTGKRDRLEWPGGDTSALTAPLPRAFLSKLTKETDRLTVLAFRALRQLGVPAFHDREYLVAGKPLGKAVTQGLACADVVVMFLSPGYDSSKWCTMEARAALEWGKPHVVAFCDGFSPDEAPAALKSNVGQVFAKGRTQDEERRQLYFLLEGVLVQLAELDGRPPLGDDDKAGIAAAVNAAYGVRGKLYSALAVTPEHGALPYYVRSCLCADRMPLRVEEAMREIEGGGGGGDTKSKLGVSELLEHVQRFVAGDERVLLLLGEAGTGKSLLTVWLAEELLNHPRGDELLPVRVELRHMSHADLSLGLTHVLQKTSGLKEAEIEELYRGRCVFILDGYDELRGGGGKRENVLDTLGRDAGESARFIVTCRVRTLPQQAERVRLFGGRSGTARAERFLLPFTERQRDEYIAQRVAADEETKEPELSPAEAYTRALAGSSSVRELVRNPFVLRLFVEALPRLGDTARKVSRHQLYEAFVAQWFAKEAAKASVQELLRGIKEKHREATFSYFCTELARLMHEQKVLTAAPPSGDARRSAALTRHMRRQGAQAEEASQNASTDVWRRVFEQLKDELGVELGDSEEARRKFMQTSPVRLGGGAYSFVHKSFWEYFLAVHLLDLAEDAGADDVDEAAVDAAVRGFGMREFHRAEPNVRDFLRDALMRADEGGGYALNEQRREGLMRVVRRSAAGDSETAAVAAANAVTVLHAANHRLAGADLRGVRIRGANLGTAVLDGVDLRGADMRGVSLTMASLRGAKLQDTRWSGMPFGGLLEGHTDIVWSASFSSDGRHVVSASWDKTVRVWDAESGEEVRRLEGHTQRVVSASFSSDGRHVVSASDDMTVRVWDAESGEDVQRLEGHTGGVYSASFSSDGRHVVSASYDRTVRAWDWESGEEAGRWSDSEKQAVLSRDDSLSTFNGCILKRNGNAVQLLSSDPDNVNTSLLHALPPHARGHVPSLPGLAARLGEVSGRTLDCEGADFSRAIGLPGSCRRMLRSAGAST